MFRGSIPADVRSYLREAVSGWPVDRVFVGCSGNFTVERVLHDLGRFELHGNDVGCYTSILGAYFAGKPLALRMRPEWRDDLGYIEPALGDPVTATATAILLTRMAQNLGKPDAYSMRIMAAYERDWPRLLGKTAERVRSTTLRLASYAPADVADWLQTVPNGAGVVSYPPFYEQPYQAYDGVDLGSILDWTAPPYQLFTPERRMEVLERIADRDWWLFGIPVRVPEWEHELKGVARTTNRGVPIYLYGRGPFRIASPNQRVESFPLPRLGNDALGDRISIRPLTFRQFYALRSQFMNIGIRPGRPSLVAAVVVSGRLVGVYAIVLPRTGKTPLGWREVPQPSIYLLSDFPVRPTRYRHLAKLVLYAALSRESQLMIERLIGRRIRSLTTTAFTNNPISMKYRGLFELLSRKELTIRDTWDNVGEISYYRQRYELEYGAPLAQWTLAEGFALWRERYGQQVVAA